LSVPGAEMQTLHSQLLPALKRFARNRQLRHQPVEPGHQPALRNARRLSNLLHQIYDPGPQLSIFSHPPSSPRNLAPRLRIIKRSSLRQSQPPASKPPFIPTACCWMSNGSVHDVQKALHVTLHTYSHPTEKRTFTPQHRAVAKLSVHVLQISGLDNFALPRPICTPRGSQAAIMSQAMPFRPNGTYMGTDFRKAYVPDTTLSGSGQIVGLLQFDVIRPATSLLRKTVGVCQTCRCKSWPARRLQRQPPPASRRSRSVLDIETTISMATNLSK